MRRPRGNSRRSFPPRRASCSFAQDDNLDYETSPLFSSLSSVENHSTLGCTLILSAFRRAAETNRQAACAPRIGGRKSEVRSQKSEVRGQRSEVRGQRGNSRRSFAFPPSLRYGSAGAQDDKLLASIFYLRPCLRPGYTS
jgi:hypothetical protein